MIEMSITDRARDQAVIEADEPITIEWTLIPTSDGDRIHVFVYKGTGDEVNIDSEPVFAYDGTIAHEMRDVTV